MAKMTIIEALKKQRQDIQSWVTVNIRNVLTKLNQHTSNADMHVTAADKTVWDGKANKSDIPTGSLAKKNTVSESDLDSALAGKVNAASAGNHSHSNKDVLDGISSTKVAAWDALTAHTHDVSKNTSSVLGSSTTFTVGGGKATTTNIKASASGTSVASNGTANAITALGTPTTAAAITDLNTATIKNPSVTAGKAASWSATVTNGVLEFTWSANTPTGVTTSDTTVVTGSKSTANAITGFGAHTTKAVLTGVKVTQEPSITLSTSTTSATGSVAVATGVSDITVTANTNNKVDAVTSVTVGAPK